MTCSQQQLKTTVPEFRGGMERGNQEQVKNQTKPNRVNPNVAHSSRGLLSAKQCRKPWHFAVSVGGGLSWKSGHLLPYPSGGCWVLRFFDIKSGFTLIPLSGCPGFSSLVSPSFLPLHPRQWKLLVTWVSLTEVFVFESFGCNIWCLLTEPRLLLSFYLPRRSKIQGPTITWDLMFVESPLCEWVGHRKVVPLKLFRPGNLNRE